MKAVESGVREVRPTGGMDAVTAAKVAFLSNPASYPDDPPQVERLASVVITDSVGPGPAAACSSGDAAKLTVLSVGPLLGQALRQMLDGKPLAPLLERWPISVAD
jgi:hypothetical protein